MKNFNLKGIKFSPKIPRQIISLAVIFAILIVAFIIGRKLFVPPSFGKYGHYRANAPDEIASQKLNYAGYQVCTSCHNNIYKLIVKSNHKGVSCETCHGPAAKHTSSPGEYKPIVPREREHCQLCHAFNPSRPTGFPRLLQKPIILEKHVWHAMNRTTLSCPKLFLNAAPAIEP